MLFCLGLDQTEDTAILVTDLYTSFLVQIVAGWHLKVDDCAHILEDRLRRVPSVQHHYDVELANVEKVNH